MFGELADRAGKSESVHWVEYAAPVDAAFDDEDAWHAANPGLADGIKSLDYMRAMSERAKAVPASAGNFAAYDLNQPQEPSRQLILTVRQWLACTVETLPERKGPCFVGVDLGGSSSMTASVVYWPESGRFEAMGAFPAVPDLDRRGDADGVGGRYVRMAQLGELTQTSGSVTDVAEFLERLRNDLAGERIYACGLDRYRREEATNAFATLGWRLPLVWRGQGASATSQTHPCLLYTSPSPRDRQKSRMPSSA